MGMIGNSLAQGLISGANIQDGTVDTPDIKDSAVTAAKIASGVVTPAKMDFSAGTANGVLYLNGSKVASSGSAFVFDGTNVGIGTTPSAWGGTYKALQVSSSGALAGNGGYSTFLANNIYADGSNWKYLTSTANIGAQMVGLNPNGAGGFAWFTAPSGTAGNNIAFNQAMTLDASGNFMVGGTSANGRVRFVAAASSDCVVNIEPSTNNYASGLILNALNDNGAGYNFLRSQTSGGTSHWEINGAASASTMRILTGGTERARIDSNGKLLVGASTGGATSTRIYGYQTSQDDNNGIIQADAGSGTSASVICRSTYGTSQLFQWSAYGSRIGSRSIANGSPGSVFFSVGNDAVTARADTDNYAWRFGSVGVSGSSGAAVTIYGTTAGDIVQFHQSRNGTSPYWYFNTSGTYGVYSDARLKENITLTAQQDSVDFIKGLEIVEFNWKPEYGNSETRVSGFLAQNVLKAAKTEGQKNILTNWETYDENDPDCKHMGLGDHRVIPSVVHALQAAMAQIEAQQALITTLTERITALEGATQ